MAITKRGRQEMRDMCPKCLMDAGESVPLLIRFGSGEPIRCAHGHKFEDREELSRLMMEASKTAIGFVQRPKDEEEDSPAERLEVVDEKSKESQSLIQERAESGIFIDAVDIARISSIVGSFSDSSTLYGAIYALNEELLRQRAEADRLRKTVSNVVSSMGGSLSVTVSIPERHVEVIKDIAESQGLDVATYLNSLIEHGMDNGWYY